MTIEAPVSGQKIDGEKMSNLILKFNELISEEELHDNDEQKIKYLGMFIENERKNLTNEEINYLKEKLFPKKKNVKEKIDSYKFPKPERRNYLDNY